jgi:hypothetical protein
MLPNRGGCTTLSNCSVLPFSLFPALLVLSMSDRYHGLVIYLMKVICADRYVVLIKKVVLHTDIVVNTLFQQKFANIKMQSNV